MGRIHNISLLIIFQDRELANDVAPGDRSQEKYPEAEERKKASGTESTVVQVSLHLRR